MEMEGWVVDGYSIHFDFAAAAAVGEEGIDLVPLV
jgi:hypothetical protein